MTTTEWKSIVEGVRRVHRELKDYSDEQIEKFVKDTTYGHLLHSYVDFPDEHKEHLEP